MAAVIIEGSQQNLFGILPNGVTNYLQIEIWVNIIVIIAMNNFQRIVNLFAIIAALYLLYDLSAKINKKYGKYVDYNQIVQTIGRGDTLTEAMVQQISALYENEQPSILQTTPLCLFKAYYAIVIKQKLDPKGLFYLFQHSQHQYDNVDSCLNYYSVLLFRAQSLEAQVKSRVVRILQILQKTEINRKYKDANDKQNICVYFSTFNNQKSIKSQIAALSAQNYKSYNVQIDDRGSSDNTHIISTYVLSQFYNNTQAKILVNTNKNTKGPLSGLKAFTEKCQEGSIVLIVAENETLIGSNALELISRVFANQRTDIAVFSSLSSTHLNLEFPPSQIELKNVASPIVAFRKEVLLETDKLLKIQQQTKLLQHWKNWLANHLIYLAGKSSAKLKIINQGIVSSESIKSSLQPTEIEQIQAKYASLI